MLPFLDLKATNARQRTQLLEAAARVIDSGHYIGGQEVEAFENEFANYCGVDYATGTGNGLDALQLIFKALISLGQLQPGDEVLVPANTFIASLLSISHAGLKPRVLDPNPDTFNLTAEGIKKALTPNTRAILLVHLYGQLADVQAVQALAKQQQLILIEDAAQAQGAHLNGHKAGSWGLAAAFSFYPGKNLGALGDAGMVVSKDRHLAERVRQLANYGSSAKYQHSLQGYNSRLDALQAAFLRVKLTQLDEDNALRQHLACYYHQAIDNPYIHLPKFPDPLTQHVFHIYALCTPYRKALGHHLTNQGIGYGMHYPLAPHQQASYPSLQTEPLPITERLAQQQLSLPLSPAMTEQQLKKVIEAVNCFKPS